MSAITIVYGGNEYVWNVEAKINSESDEVPISVQIRELCEWRDNCDCIFLTKEECQTIINDLCTK